ncbi:MAG: GNAT family N-acetyltransferase [Oscillochloris sp.]|nr:GNAT family N-acetyltransferase [Oscillochloris sp.]
MWLFRKSLDLRTAYLRPLNADDLTVTSRLLRDGARRMYALSGGDLPALLAAGYAVGLWIGSDLIGVFVVSWPNAGTCWLRAAALAEGVEVRPGLELLLPALNDQLRQRQIRTIYYAGDEDADSWLIPVLLNYGYLPDTEVVVYEKRNRSIPDPGNPAILLRPACSEDLAAILELDRICFEYQWMKDGSVLGPAILDGSLFVVAELHAQPVGYAYATSHFGGRLLHLVRIAVDPHRRGARIGVRLLAEVTQYAADRQSDVITLNTQAYNSRAQRLYEWFGFMRTGERQQILRFALNASDSVAQSTS